MKSLFLLAILLFSFTFAFAQNEQAPIVEKDIKYKDWTYKSIRTDEGLNFRNAVKGKKLVMVVYFAPWCPNWKHEAPFAERMYEKYKGNGFEIIGVGEYDEVEAMKGSLDFFKITFPAVYESESKASKQYTLHYEYRKSVGDTRGWGSPWNIFLEPSAFEKKSDTLVKKAFVVNGELIEAEAEKFIREKLGLPAEEIKTETAAKDKGPETCEPDKKTTQFIKP